LGRLDTLFQRYLKFLPQGKQQEADELRKSATSQIGGVSPLGDPVAEADAQLHSSHSQ